MFIQQSEFAYWRHTYRHEFDFFFFDLSVNYNDDDYTIYRSVKFFVKQIITRKNANFQFVIVYCLQNSAYEWFKSLVEFVQKYVIKNFNTLCKKFVETFESIEQKQRIQKQVEKVRITKKRKKTFACKRCFIKFSSNTKFHQHIQNHHQKKFAKSANEFAIIAFFTSFRNEFELFTSNSKFTSKAMLVKFISSEFAYRTSISRNEFANSTSNEFAKFSSFFKFFAERDAFYINYFSI